MPDHRRPAFLAGYRWPGGRAGYHLPAVQGGIAGWRVGVVDDAVNAGTAVVACLEELRGRGAVPVAVATLVSLGEASTMVQARMRVPFYRASTGTEPGMAGRTMPAVRRRCSVHRPFIRGRRHPLPGRGLVRAGTSGFRGGNADVSADACAGVSRLMWLSCCCSSASGEVPISWSSSLSSSSSVTGSSGTL